MTDRRDGTVDFTNSDRVLIDAWRAVVHSMGLTAADRLTRNVWRSYVVSKPLRRVLESIGLGYSRGPAKTTPPLIFDALPDVRAAYIRGLFDTDGSVCRSIRFTTSSPAMAQDVQRILISLGVVAYVTSQNERHHKVSVSGPSVLRYASTVGFLSPAKRLRLSALVARLAAGKTNLDYVPFGSLILTQVFAAMPSARGRAGQGINRAGDRGSARLYLARAGKIRTSYAHLLIAKTLLAADGVIVPDLDRTLAENYYFDPIGRV